MDEIEQLKHRLAMVADDLKAIRQFIDQQGLTEAFKKPSELADQGFTHLNNIEVACDLTTDESFTWNLF